MTVYFKTAYELLELLDQREISVLEIIEAHFSRIKAVDPEIKAFITLDQEQARNLAQTLDAKLKKTGKELKGLWGIPAAIKDNICTSKVRTTCASMMLKDYIPSYDATVIERLDKAGMVMLGKTNLDEFAMGSSTENSAFFTSRNPWDLKCVPGGSSGGSAAAVAAGEAVFALGSDTGGSIRQPAAFCGIVGLKPTYGLVSRYGLMAFASSLDQIGPLTRDVTDCALVMNFLAGHDPKDSTSSTLEKPGDLTMTLKADIKGLKIGIPREYFAQGVDPEITKKVYECITLLTKLGARAEDVFMPHTEAALPTYYILAPAEASSNLARYDGVRYGYRAEAVEDLSDLYAKTRSKGFGPEVKRRIMLGAYALSSGYYDAYYLKAQKVRTLIKEDFDQAFEKYDVLISPTTPTTAFKIGENTVDPLAMYMSDICTVPANMAGIPAISIPVGFDSKGLPIGLQILGKHFSEALLLRVAYTLEQELKITELHPQL